LAIAIQLGKKLQRVHFRVFQQNGPLATVRTYLVFLASHCSGAPPEGDRSGRDHS
jgi:hypothetical protein